MVKPLPQSDHGSVAPKDPSGEQAGLSRLNSHQAGSDVLFYLIFSAIGGMYLLLILAMLIADAAYMIRGADECVLDPAWTQQHPFLAIFVNNPLGAAELFTLHRGEDVRGALTRQAKELENLGKD